VDVAKFLNTKNWRTAVKHRSDWRNKQGRPLPGNGPKSHRKKKKEKKEEEEEEKKGILGISFFLFFLKTEIYLKNFFFEYTVFTAALI
jgi:hypothetical protein